MTERSPREELVNNLLAQDSKLSQTQMEEQRMRLEQTIDRAERQARHVRIGIYLSIGTYLTAFALLPFLAAVGNRMGTALNMVWVIALTAAPLCAIWFIVVYLVKYRPAVGQTRTEFQNTIILQLQQQVAELTERLSKEGK